MKTTHLFLGIQVSIYLLFVVFNLGMVFSQGVCCGDDAYHAMVAKNLAEGRGYASSLPIGQTHSTMVLFDPLLGTGPTIILPTALMIALFGNAYWVPGLTNVILWSVLILSIGIVLNQRVPNKAGLTISIVFFFIFAYLFTAYHFEQWYALFGEIPTALLIILAILLYFFHDSKIYLSISGILFSIAFEAKMIALLPFISFILFIAIYQFIANSYQLKATSKKIIVQILFILIGFCIPISLFELYRFMSLHLHGYIAYWHQSIDYISTAGVEANKDLLTIIGERIDLAIRRFGLFLPIIFPLLACLGYALRKDKRLLAIFIAFSWLIVVYSFYWLVISVGWARYFVIPLVLFVFSMVLPFISDTFTIKYKILYFIVLAGLIFYNMRSIDSLIQFRTPQLFKPSSSVRALIEINELLSTHINEVPFLTQWWATGIDVEYMMKTSLNFTSYYDIEIDLHQPHIVVINKKFLMDNDQRYLEYENICSKKEINRYEYMECGPLPNP